MNKKCTEWPYNNIPNIRKIFQMTIKYTNIFQSKALQKLPNWDFWFKNKPSGNPDVVTRNQGDQMTLGK
jgi:L-amino acid N-acyltransferase YncA